MKHLSWPIGALVIAALSTSAVELSGQQQQPGQSGQSQAQQTQTQAQSITGQVTSREGNQVTIRTDAGETRTVVVETQTRIMGPSGALAAQPREDRINQLQVGDRVTIQYRPGAQPEQFVAVEMSFPDGPAQMQAQQPNPALTPGTGQTAQAGQATPTRLPQTAGYLPVVGALGLLSLIGAAGVGALTRASERKE